MKNTKMITTATHTPIVAPIAPRPDSLSLIFSEKSTRKLSMLLHPQFKFYKHKTRKKNTNINNPGPARTPDKQGTKGQFHKELGLVLT